MERIGRVCCTADTAQSAEAAADADADTQAQADTGRCRTTGGEGRHSESRATTFRPDGTISVVTGKPVGDIDMDDTTSPDPSEWN